MLARGFARVGIISLVDEATGYQKVRRDRALADILEKFIEKKLRPWTRTFPDEFYEELCRLKGWSLDHVERRPGIMGHLTNYIVYDRLAPGVLDELRRLNPRTTETGQRRHKHHQWLTADIGHPKLREHLIGVLALMRTAMVWREFEILLWRAFPSQNETSPLAFPAA